MGFIRGVLGNVTHVSGNSQGKAGLCYISAKAGLTQPSKGAREPSVLSQVGRRILAFASLDVGSSRNVALWWFKNTSMNYLTDIHPFKRWGLPSLPANEGWTQ